MLKLFNTLMEKANLSPGRRKILVNVCWAVLGKVVNIICGVLVGVLVARYLGPDKFGLMNYVISYVTLFSVFASFGLDGIEIRELSKHNADKNTILGTAFALRLFFALAAFVLIFFTLWRFESDCYTFAMVLIYSLSMMFSAFNVIRNYFTSIILNEYVVKTEIFRTVIGAGIKVVLLLLHGSLAWFIAASTFDFLFVGGGYVYSYRGKVGPLRDWRFDAFLAKMLVRSSFPLLLSGTAIIIYQKINSVMIRNMLDNADVGQFAVAERLSELGTFIPLVIAQTVTPFLVKAHQEDEFRYREKRQQFMDIMVWSAIAMAVVVCAFAAPAIRILYGDRYLAAIPSLQIMAWGTVFMALAAASGQLIIIENLQRYAVFRNLTGCVVSIGFNFLLIPVFGVAGSSFTVVLSLAFAGYISHFWIKPYRHLAIIQSHALLLGWRQGMRMLKSKLS